MIAYSSGLGFILPVSWVPGPEVPAFRGPTGLPGGALPATPAEGRVHPDGWSVHGGENGQGAVGLRESRGHELSLACWAGLRTSQVRTTAGRLWGLPAAWLLGACLPASVLGRLSLSWLIPESCLGSTSAARDQASQG